MAFRTTRWSLVVAAGKDAELALSDLIEVYWYPLYAFARHQGANADEAADLVQGFFTALIEKNYLGRADPERGRFRTFLLTAFRRYASKERAKEGAKKRGGDRIRFPLDFDRGESRYANEPGDDRTPERLYERAWALALLEKVLDELGDAYRRTDRGVLFELLRPFLVGGAPLPSMKPVEETLDMTESAVKVALHRLRKRYRDALRQEIAETVDDPSQVNDEIRHLMDSVG